MRKPSIGAAGKSTCSVGADREERHHKRLSYVLRFAMWVKSLLLCVAVPTLLPWVYNLASRFLEPSA